MYDASTDPSAKLRDLEELSGLLGLFASEVQATTWPASAQNAISSLTTATRAARTADDQLISNPTSETAAAFTAAVGTLTANSSLVRVAFGLPPLG